MSFKYDVAGARSAIELGLIEKWVQAYLKEPLWANRALAAILHGQQPRWEGPVLIELEHLYRVAGPGPEFRYPKDPVEWTKEVVSISNSIKTLEDLPPLIVRHQPDRLHLSDGNHRVDALKLLGYSKAWALVWHDRSPGCTDTWSPFAPESSPVLGIAKGDAMDRAKEFGIHNFGCVREDTIFITAEIDEQPIGVLTLAPDGNGLRIVDLFVQPHYRNRLVGTRLLRELQKLEAPIRFRVDKNRDRWLESVGFVRTGDDVRIR